MVLITIVNGVYKPSYNWGAPPCMILLGLSWGHQRDNMATMWGPQDHFFSRSRRRRQYKPYEYHIHYQIGSLSQLLGKIKHVPNHQPDYDSFLFSIPYHIHCIIVVYSTISDQFSWFHTPTPITGPTASCQTGHRHKHPHCNPHPELMHLKKKNNTWPRQ